MKKISIITLLAIFISACALGARATIKQFHSQEKYAWFIRDIREQIDIHQMNLGAMERGWQHYQTSMSRLASRKALSSAPGLSSDIWTDKEENRYQSEFDWTTRHLSGLDADKRRTEKDIRELHCMLNGVRGLIPTILAKMQGEV